MKKYIIVDWCSNIVFNDKYFDSFDEARGFIEERFEDDIEDIYVEEINEDSRIVPYDMWNSSDKYVLKQG